MASQRTQKQSDGAGRTLIKNDIIQPRSERMTRLEKQQKKEEMRRLERLLTDAPSIIKNLKAKARPKLSEDEQQLIQTAHKYLAKLLKNRPRRSEKLKPGDKLREQVIAKLELGETTVEKACRKLDVSPATIYRYRKDAEKSSAASSSVTSANAQESPEIKILAALTSAEFSGKLSPEDFENLEAAFALISRELQAAKNRAEKLRISRTAMLERKKKGGNHSKAAQPLDQEKSKTAPKSKGMDKK